MNIFIMFLLLPENRWQNLNVIVTRLDYLADQCLQLNRLFMMECIRFDICKSNKKKEGNISMFFFLYYIFSSGTVFDQ